jgi:hypothetical protein
MIVLFSYLPHHYYLAENYFAPMKWYFLTVSCCFRCFVILFSPIQLGRRCLEDCRQFFWSSLEDYARKTANDYFASDFATFRVQVGILSFFMSLQIDDVYPLCLLCLVILTPYNCLWKNSFKSLLSATFPPLSLVSLNLSISTLCCLGDWHKFVKSVVLLACSNCWTMWVVVYFFVSISRSVRRVVKNN